MTTLTIRKGAAHWDATLKNGDQTTVFDFRTMTSAERAKWYTVFMASIRRLYGYSA